MNSREDELAYYLRSLWIINKPTADFCKEHPEITLCGETPMPYFLMIMEAIERLLDGKGEYAPD